MNELSKFQKQVEELFDVSIAPLNATNKLELSIVNGKPVLDFEYQPEGGGFSVYFGVEDSEYYFSADQWHEHSEFILPDGIALDVKARRAIDQLLSLLNGQTYIEVSKAGNFAYKWTLCSFDESRNTTGLLFYPYWAKKTTHKLQNNVLAKQLDYNPWE